MINFNIEINNFKLLDRNKKRLFIRNLSRSKGYKVGELSYVFLSDEDLLKINLEYLDHDTYTDIITFDNSEEDDLIEGDIFISIDRVRENACNYGVEFERELIRVMAHGILHLAGYKDKTFEESAEMKAEEEKALMIYFQ